MKNDISSGYDAICKWCEAVYVYSNARGLKVKQWKFYCSKLCQDHDERFVTDALRRKNRKVTARLLAEQSLLTQHETDGLPPGHHGSSLECMHPFCVAEREAHAAAYAIRSAARRERR